jgi:hypothetical protein
MYCSVCNYDMPIHMRIIVLNTGDHAHCRSQCFSQNLAVARGQLPEGRSPAEVFKVCRKKKAAFKAKGQWGTKCDIAYEDFIRAINKTVKPDNRGGVL